MEILQSHRPIVMGILNITPDSFFDGGKYNSDSTILNQVETMLSEGASIIDIGGYSSRPGAENISTEEELERITKPIELIRTQFPNAVISIDTFRSQVAKRAVNLGANMINDISSGSLDDEMFETVATLKVPYILMHMKGNPQTMQSNTDYQDLVNEVKDYFELKIKQLRKLGVEEIIIDPGFGFSKTVEQNYKLLKELSYFCQLETPILVGISRKSMISKVINTTSEHALNGTSALHMTALMNGANILRAHDVKEAVEVIKLHEQLKQ